MAIEVQRLLTPDDVERMVRCGEIDPDATWEFVNGEFVWMAPAFDPQPAICSTITGLLFPFARAVGARLEDSSAGFWVGEGGRQLRAPDVSLITRERLHIVHTDRFNQGAPDLAVEVLSKGEFGAAYARMKIPEYFAAGAKVVWFVDPRNSSVREYIAGSQEIRVYSGAAAITLDPIAPGFSCPVSEFFRV